VQVPLLPARLVAARSELLEPYSAGSDLDLSQASLYLAFNCWKTAYVNESAYSHYAQQQKRPVGVDLESIGSAVTLQVELAARTKEQVH
jgi:aminoglycoside phosphotransferase (APT) family kinase protein